MCQWIHYKNHTAVLHSEIYETVCGMKFHRVYPIPDTFKFCPFCGKEIELKEENLMWEHDHVE